MSAHDLCSSESSDSVSSVVLVVDKSAATAQMSVAAVVARPTSFLARHNGTAHQEFQQLTSSVMGDTAGGSKQRARPNSLPNGYLGNGCYSGCSSGSSSDDDDDDDSGRSGLHVDDGGRGRGQQLDMDTSSSSSECSQIWIPVNSSLASPTTTHPSGFEPSGSRCRHSLVDASGCEGGAATSRVAPAACNDTKGHVKAVGLLETDLDEVYGQQEQPQSGTVGNDDHQQRSRAVPADSGLGNDASTLDYSDEGQIAAHHQASIIDQSPCDSVTLMRALPRPSMSFNSRSCSFHRSSMSSLQPLQPIDGAAAGDNAPIYSTPSTCRASLSRMQSVAPPTLPSAPENSVSNEERRTFQTQYPGIHKLDISTMISCLYAMFVVVVGSSLSLAEVLMNTMSIATFEGFYAYLFVTGIVSLLIVQLYMARHHSSRGSGVCSRESCYMSSAECGSESLGGVELALLDKTATPPPSVPVVGVSKYGGTFLLRMGAVGFAVGAMISECLQFAQFVEMNRTIACINAAEVIRTVLNILFIFTQLYFIFMHSETRLKRQPAMCRLGVMHLIATNVCIWIRIVVLETLAAGASTRLLQTVEVAYGTSGTTVDVTPMIVYRHLTAVSNQSAVYQRQYLVKHIGSHDDTSGLVNTSSDGFISCKLPDVTSGILASVSPYLYPCIIQYCWTAIALNALIWFNIGHHRAKSFRDDVRTPSRHTQEFNRPVGSRSGTSPGVFLGLIVLVASVVVLVVSLVQSSGGIAGPASRSSMSASDAAAAKAIADALSDCTRLGLSTISGIATVLVAGCLLRRGGSGTRPLAVAPSCRAPHTIINELLLVVSLAGVLSAGIFGAVAARRIGRHLAVAGDLCSAAQAAVQAVAIVVRCRRGGLAGRLSKTGRQMVAFLLVCNVALWLVDVAQEGGLRQLMSTGQGVRDEAGAVFGELSRRALGLVCVPLAAFHRFVSVICLAAIWKRG